MPISCANAYAYHSDDGLNPGGHLTAECPQNNWTQRYRADYQQQQQQHIVHVRVGLTDWQAARPVSVCWDKSRHASMTITGRRRSMLQVPVVSAAWRLRHDSLCSLFVFSARCNNIHLALMLRCQRPYVCPSVCDGSALGRGACREEERDHLTLC